MEVEASGVAAIVVTFHPDVDALGKLFASISPQVETIVIVDNGSGGALAAWLSANAPDNSVSLLLEENRGLAAAQNLGIAEARRQGMAYVLLLDQDSLPALDMVVQLHQALDQARATGGRPAAAGPRYQDIHQGSLRPFVRIRGLRVQRFDCAHADQVFEVDHLIASGSLIPLSVIDDIGPMNEALFIDFIDTEWCLRAWRKGYLLLGVCRAAMRHNLGEQPNYFLGRYVPVHGPLRHYYLFRNATHLLGSREMPPGWKLATLKRMILVSGYFLVCRPRRIERLIMMIRGVGDGMAGRMGPCRH